MRALGIRRMGDGYPCNFASFLTSCRAAERGCLNAGLADVAAKKLAWAHPFLSVDRLTRLGQITNAGAVEAATAGKRLSSAE